jgi:hypothetical protein
MELKKDIRSLEAIPFEKDLVATGNVNRIVWFWRVPGRFVRSGEAILFVDAHGAAVPVDENINIATKEC